MANGNKAAKVSILGSYVYKNSKVDKIKMDNLNDSHAIMKGNIYIPNIKNLQDGLLSKMKTKTSNGVVIEYYTDVFRDIDQKTFDIRDNSLTLIEFDDKINGIQTIGSYTGDHLSSKNDVYTHNPDPSLYGLCFPYKSYTFANTVDTSITAKYSFYQNSNNGFLYGRNVHGYVDNLPNLIRKNILGSIKFIKPPMDKTNDRYLIPKYIPSCNPDFMELTEIIGSNLYKEGIGFISCLNLPFDSKYPDDRRYSMTFSQITDAHGNRKDSYGFSAFLRNSSSKPIDQRLIVGDVNGNLYSIVGYNTPAIESYHYWGYSFGFLTDDNGEKYILIYMNSPQGEPGGTSGGMSQYGFNNIEIMPIKELRGYKLDSNLKTVGGLVRIQDNFDVVGLIDSLLGDVVDPEDLGAPDASGPGDSYKDVNNATSSIGGHYDFTDVIEKDEGKGNENYDTFDAKSSIYGTYVLTNDKLEAYSHTLSVLYNKSMEPILGTASSLYADRIKSSTVSLQCLPVSVPASYTSNDTFVIGNTGIGDKNATWNDIANGHFTTADYLVKNQLEYIINLDPIKHRYDNFLDFPPYSTASIYIPYIGTKELPLGIIQSTSSHIKALQLKIRVDIPTGDFVALLFVDGVLISHWNSNCARTIQLSVNDNSSAVREISSQMAKLAFAAVGAGAVPKALGEVGVENFYSVPTQVSGSQHMIGSMQQSGISGWIDNAKIQIIVERPKMYLPYKYGHNVGYPTQKVVNIGSTTGFCQYGNVHLKTSATAAERDEIIRVLQQGVIMT